MEILVCYYILNPNVNLPNQAFNTGRYNFFDMKLFALFILIYLSGCADSSPTYKKLSGSDSVVINFNKENTDSITKTISATEQAQAHCKVIRTP